MITNNTVNHFNLQLKTLVESSIIVYTSSQVVSRVLCRDHHQQEAGGQEEHLGAVSVEVHKVFQVKSWLTLSIVSLRRLYVVSLVRVWLQSGLFRLLARF